MISNIDKKQMEKAAQYYKTYWKLFIEKNPHMDTEIWKENLSLVFLSGYSAGLEEGKILHSSLIEEIVQNN